MKIRSGQNQAGSLYFAPYSPVYYTYLSIETVVFEPHYIYRVRCYLLLLCCCILASTGCMQRRLTIHTNPAGALVYVDGEEIGTTPVSHDFIYYGTREIRLVKSGYETLTVLQPVETPWYQIPPLDFFSDNLAMQKIRDEREFSYQMTPTHKVPSDELLQRAEGLRTGVQLPAAPNSPYVLPENLPAMPSGVLPTQPAPKRVWPTPSNGR